MGLDVVSLDVFRPILLLFDQSRSKYTSLLEFYDAFQHTEPTAKDDSRPFGKYWLQHMKQQSNCFPSLLNFGTISDGESFPSTSSICQRMPDNEQHTVWYSLPNGHGFRGTNIHPGQLYLLVHVLLDSSKQLTQLGVTCSVMLVFHTSNFSRTSQKRSQKAGG